MFVSNLDFQDIRMFSYFILKFTKYEIEDCGDFIKVFYDGEQLTVINILNKPEIFIESNSPDLPF